jgi:hypothetical protein
MKSGPMYVQAVSSEIGTLADLDLAALRTRWQDSNHRIQRNAGSAWANRLQNSSQKRLDFGCEGSVSIAIAMWAAGPLGSCPAGDAATVGLG